MANYNKRQSQSQNPHSRFLEKSALQRRKKLFSYTNFWKKRTLKEHRQRKLEREDIEENRKIEAKRKSWKRRPDHARNFNIRKRLAKLIFENYYEFYLALFYIILCKTSVFIKIVNYYNFDKIGKWRCPCLNLNLENPVFRSVGFSSFLSTRTLCIHTL